MQLQEDLWIEGAYYADFDALGQLRIVGPKNHLHFGAIGLHKDDIKIDSVFSQEGELVVTGWLKSKKMFLHDPAVGHIQKVRHYVERVNKPPLGFGEVIRKHPTELSPNYIAVELRPAGYQISYKRTYQRHWYGVKLSLAHDVTVHRLDRRRGFNLQAAGDHIGFTLTTDADQHPESGLEQVIKSQPVLDTKAFGANKQQVDKLLDRTAIEITHLVKNDKTSGFDYGTVFPRDWMESADLGELDLEPEAIRYMYHKAFEFVNPQGIGWHENIVGEFEFEKKQEASELAASLDDLIDRSSRIGAALKDLIGQVEEMYVIRNMVDIEPRYILGLKEILPDKLEQVDLDRVRRVARYIVLQAEINDLITFKKMPAILRRHKHDEYYGAGNWRDSEQAFKMVHPIIAPYDVNAVFYPLALDIIRQHAELLEVDRKQVDSLVAKWRKVKDLYRFTNTDGSPAFALALYDVKRVGAGVEFKKLEVNHLDEAYSMYYDQPSEAEVVSFCNRLLSPDFFFTQSGPALVGAHDGYDTKQYHGRVIWTKQTAFTVAGLYRQLKRKWPADTRALLIRTIEKTTDASLQAWLKLGAVPELHYDKDGQPHWYNDQPDAEGPMNSVQLWSAVGARRIIRTYLLIEKHVRQQLSRHN